MRPNMKPLRPHTDPACFNKLDNFRDIFENATIGIFQTTPEGQYIRVNPTLASLYGYETADQMLGDLTDIKHQLYVEPHRRQEFMDTLSKHGRIENFESQVRQRDGNVIWISESARVVNGDQLDGYYEGFVEIICERKRLEAEINAFTVELESRVEKRTRELMLENERRRLAQVSLQQALSEAEKAVDEKASFLATMSHELRTPLHAIIGYVQIIQTSPQDALAPKEYDEYIDIINRSARHQLALINDILDLSKIDSGTVKLDREPVNVCDVIEECLDLMAHRAEETKVSIVRDMDTATCTQIHLDTRRIKQVLLNLLSNAIKFTPPQGNVTISLTNATKDTLSIKIEDTGVGIAQADIPKVLSEYGQAKHNLGRDIEGTGLGLPIAKKLVELHDGKLLMESILGQGTKVTVSLPLNVKNLNIKAAE